MSSALRIAIETFIRLAKAEVHPHAIMIAADDVFEIKKTPSVLFQGPTMSENGARRSFSQVVEKNEAAFTYEATRAPRLYHIDFDVVLTTATEPELLDLTEKVSRFFQVHRLLEIAGFGTLNLTETVPVGGLRRVNLSNLRQASGRCRIEDFPVYDGLIETGRLIKDRQFQFAGELQPPTTLSPNNEEITP